MTKTKLAEWMEQTFTECKRLRSAGQKEYARAEDNAFANFQRVSERLGLKQEEVLLVYLEKHLDGIHSYVQGHKSQREDVRGRINDAIVYLCILRGMVEEQDEAPPVINGEFTDYQIHAASQRLEEDNAGS